MASILVPVDFSDVTEKVLNVASKWARVEGLPVLVLYVAPPDPEYVSYRVGPQDERDYIARELREEREKVQAMAEELAAAGLRADGLVVMGGTVYKILEEAAKRDAALIVMGSHGHGALYNLIVGSVTEGVLRKAPCPVLVVPARDGDETQEGPD